MFTVRWKKSQVKLYLKKFNIYLTLFLRHVLSKSNRIDFKTVPHFFSLPGNFKFGYSVRDSNLKNTRPEVDA